VGGYGWTIRGSYPGRDKRFGKNVEGAIVGSVDVLLRRLAVREDEEGCEHMVELRTEIRARDLVNTKQKCWSRYSGVDW
jgi:hypothetical protein